MPRIKKFDIDPADVDGDGICAAQMPAAGGTQSLSLDGALISGGVFTEGSGHGRQISITSDGNESTRTFVVTGTDSDGTAVTESITGPNIATVESSKYFKTITGITVDGDTAGSVTVGTVDELATKTIMLNRHAGTGASAQYDVTGTISLQSQITLSNVREDYTEQSTLPWAPVTAAITTDTVETYTRGAVAARVLVNSYSSGGEAQIYLSEERRD